MEGLRKGVLTKILKNFCQKFEGEYHRSSMKGGIRGYFGGALRVLLGERMLLKNGGFKEISID